MSGFKRGFLLPKNSQTVNATPKGVKIEKEKIENTKIIDIHETLKTGKSSPPRFKNLNTLTLSPNGKLYASMGEHGKKEILDLRDLRHCFIGDLTVEKLNDAAIRTFYEIQKCKSYLTVEEFVINSNSKTAEQAEAIAAHMNHLHYILSEIVNAENVYCYFSTEDLKVITKNPHLVRFTSPVQRISITGTPETNSGNFFDIKLLPVGMENLLSFIEDPEVMIENRHLLNLMGQYEGEEICDRIFDLFNRISNPVTMFRIIQIWVPITFLKTIKEFAKSHGLRQLTDPAGHHDYVIVSKRENSDEWYLKITMRWMDQYKLFELKFHVLKKYGKVVECSPMCNCDSTIGVLNFKYFDDQ
uniref:Uncharacterized protein n=1 Tax=Acrobeloides nanus TaxID=290746 RepID=A0A914BY06_9BILA